MDKKKNIRIVRESVRELIDNQLSELINYEWSSRDKDFRERILEETDIKIKPKKYIVVDLDEEIYDEFLDHLTDVIVGNSKIKK